MTGSLDLPAPKLYGRHQFENAGTAIAALRAAGLKLPVAAFEAGMTQVEWPARMQRLAHGRLAALLPPESELWLDGGHNADGGRAVAGALADLEERVSRPLVLVVGMLSTKDSEGFLRNFSGLARRVIAVPIHQDKAVPAEALAGIAQDHRHSGDCPRHCGERADGRRQARPASGAARSHHRLALSRRRSFGRQRHAAGVARHSGRRAAANPESITTAATEPALRFVLREPCLWISGSRTSFAPRNDGSYGCRDAV